MLLDKGYLPTGAETFAVLGRWGVLLCCMETGMVLVTLAVFSRECLYLYHKWPPRAALLSCAALSVFPFTAICALSAAIFPHMYDVASALVMLYLPFSLVMYYELVATYAGGCQMLWELLADQRMPLKGPPLCCVLPPCCGPGPILTRKRQRLMRYFIYQLLAVPVLLVGVIFVCTLAGVHPGDRLEATNASPYLMVIQALSFVLGTYALVICVKLAARHLPQHALRRKFTVFHLHYTITRLQVIFFKLTGLTASLPCIPPLSSMASGIYMSCAMLIGQCFLMSTVSQYFFLHTPPVAFLGPPSELMAYEAGADKHSKRGGRTERWLLPHRRSGCRSALQQNSVPVAAGCLGATPPVSVRPNAIDYTNETFSSEPSDPGAEGPAGLGLVMGSTLQPPPPLGLSCLMASSNNQNNNNINNNNNHHRINSNNHLGVTRRVNAHAPLTRALSHPVAGAPGAAPPSLSIGTLRRVPFSVPNPVNSPQCGAPASRAKLTLDLKTTHTITLDRKWRRRQVLTRCSSASSLEDELDLKVSTMAEATTVRRREHELVAARKRSPQVDAEDQQLRHRGRNTADLCNSLVTCSLDEALRIREVRERRARLWRVSVAGGERWASLASQGPPWPVTSLEETHHFDMNDHSDANAWINEVSQRWLR
ncbi:hypothetical protein BIW11_05591 [Tropilaelaps mercedesae]|uniref:Uncharacterized protein n=1 Tax=Tropilaelaps mercedesae TaxID=418985 RepID=A0A1V9Y1K0_9ACAR|nr:hypothetical protein BIW11_05591 [Tropilaelaps mercedesae]